MKAHVVVLQHAPARSHLRPPEHPLSSPTSPTAVHPFIPSPSSPSRWRKFLSLSVCGCRQMRCGGDSRTTCLLSDTPPPLPPPLRLPLQANLVAAFEQSLALMTARLQTLSVSSDQKVHADLKLQTLQ